MKRELVAQAGLQHLNEQSLKAMANIEAAVAASLPTAANFTPHWDSEILQKLLEQSLNARRLLVKTCMTARVKSNAVKQLVRPQVDKEGREQDRRRNGAHLLRA
jgi:hypothetical protein